MKRILTLALALCLILSLAACGGPETVKPESTEAPKTEAPATEAPKTEAPATEAPATDAPATEAPATETPATEAPATEPAQDNGVRGAVEGDAYVNEYLNLRIARPDGWIFYTDDQIAQINNVTAEMFKDSDYADLISQRGQMTDMMMSDTAGNSVNLILQPNQSALAAYTDEQIFQLVEEMMRSQFEAAGMNLSTYEVVTAKLGGVERTALHMVLGDDVNAVDEYQFWLREQPDFMGVLTVAILDGSDIQPVLDGITNLN